MARSEELRAGLETGYSRRDPCGWSGSLPDLMRLAPSVPLNPAGLSLRDERPSRVSFHAAAAVAIIALVAACSPPPPAIGPVVVAPRPQEYSCEQQRRLANEFAALPAGSMLKTAIVDYGRERDQLRAVHGLPRPAACP